MRRLDDCRADTAADRRRAARGPVLRGGAAVVLTLPATACCSIDVGQALARPVPTAQ